VALGYRAAPVRSFFRRRAAVGSVGQLALVPAAAFAVHQFRYLIAFGDLAGPQLQRTGHSYLHSLAPWLVLLLALAAGGFLRALGQAFAGQKSVPRYTVSLATLWIACSVSLVVIYVGQEFLEGLFATGHPAGLAGIFGFGGWWALPSAGCAGLVLAVWLHGARWVLDEVARRQAPRNRSRPSAPASVPRPRDAFRPAPTPLAGGRSGRGPPVVSS
jgi:hypothetical protein